MRLNRLRHIRSGGFTLLELLIVIAILGILAAILFSLLPGIFATKKKVLATKQIKEIEEAAKQYYRELGSYPPDTGIYEADDQPPQGLDANSAKYAIHRYLGTPLLDPLTGQKYGPFLVIKPVDLKGDAAEVDGKQVQFFSDPWGNPYELDCMHVTRDKATKKLNKPSFPFPPGTVDEELILEVKAWSKGPDGKSGEKAQFYPVEKAKEDEDNIMSWTTGDKTQPQQQGK